LKYGNFGQKFPKKSPSLPSLETPFFHCQVVKFFHQNKNKNAAVVFQIFSLFLGGE
jgi:hypothetical protein